MLFALTGFTLASHLTHQRPSYLACLHHSVCGSSGRVLGIVLDILDELDVVVVDELMSPSSEVFVHLILGLKPFIACCTCPLELLLG